MKITERYFTETYIFMRFEDLGYYRLPLESTTYIPQVGDEFDFRGLSPENQEQYILDHRCSCSEYLQRHTYIQQSDEHELKEEVR